MVDVLCDTSFLIILASAPIRRLDRIEAQLGKLNFLVPDVVLNELTRLHDKAGPKRSMMSKSAIELSKTRFKVVSTAKDNSPSSTHVDNSLINYAVSNRCAVATIDTNLRKKLSSKGVLVLTLSNNKLIIMQPPSAMGRNE